MSCSTQSAAPVPHVADSHEVIRVVGARENNLKNVSVEIPKRRLTVFTGVSGSGKSSLVFGTIATESQRLINETYPTFVQQFMGQLGPARGRRAREPQPGDHRRPGAHGRQRPLDGRHRHRRARDAPHPVQPPRPAARRLAAGVLVQHPVGQRERAPSRSQRGSGKRSEERRSFELTGGMCPRCEGLGEVSDVDLDELFDSSKSLAEGAITIPGYNADGWMVRGFTESGFLDPDKPIKDYTEQERHDFLYKEPTKVKIQGINMTYEGLVPKITKRASCRRTATPCSRTSAPSSTAPSSSRRAPTAAARA